MNNKFQTNKSFVQKSIIMDYKRKNLLNDHESIPDLESV